MCIYYVSNDGSDSADGMTPETAWRTTDKVNATVKVGDEIRFRCGDIFYGGLRPEHGTSPEYPTVYTSYGEGARPIISLYKIPHADAWEKVSDNIYRIDMLDASKLDGNNFSSQLDSNAGFMKISGKIFYRKMKAIDELSEQWDFYSDNREGMLYVYSQDAPSKLSDDIKIACCVKGISLRSYQRICNLEICGTGAHGISGITAGSYISNCYIHEIGGSELIGHVRPNVRYGNCIEAWSNSHDVTVENCQFSDVYDVAITMQGDEVRRSWENMYFNNNKFWDCTQCFEIWSRGDDPSVGFVNCHFENNVCIDTGRGWGYAARPYKSVATPLLIYNLHTDVCDINISGNLFANSNHAIVYKSGGGKAIPSGYVIKGNTVIRSEGQGIIARESDDEGDDEFERQFMETNTVIGRVDF